jgi:FHA domain-containing protein
MGNNMDSCSRCNWSGPAGLATCPRCGQSLSSGMAPTLIQTGARPVLLLKLLGGELPPEEWEIEGVPAGIGRLDDSEITLPHRSVSRHHARIVPTASGYEIEDLGSTNGTWLNDRPLNDRVALADGDSLMVGDIPLVVELIQPQRQAQAEIFDVPQLPAAPERAPQTPTGGASTVFYELDAALAAAGPAEPPPPLQPAQRPADYQRPPSAAAPLPAEPVLPVQPAQPPADYQRTQSAAAPPAEPPRPLQPAQPPADYQRTPSAAEPPPDYQRTVPPSAPLTAAKPPADYQRTVTPAPPLTAAKPPADDQRTPPPAPPPLQPAQRPADYQRTPPPAAQAPVVQPPPAEVELPRAWDDTPSTRYDLPRSTDVDDRDASAAGDEHPTLIGEVPTQQFQSPPAAQAPPAPAPTPQRAPPPAVQTPAWYDPQPAPARTPQREPLPAVQQPPWAESLPAVPPVSGPAPSMPPAIGADLSAASMIDLAERLATALRLLKGDIALAMWLFEHAGGPPAAQAFVEQAQRLQADPNNAQELAVLVDSAPTAAHLLEAAILLVNVLSSLDPVGGVDNQLEADAANLQPVARS